MRLLLDTPVLLDFFEVGRERDKWPTSVHDNYLSVASLWEIAIKVRNGKLRIGVPLNDFTTRTEELGIRVLPVVASHAMADVEPLPLTRDPFDRLLLAVCMVEQLLLVTRDAALRDHPLAWRPGSA